MSERRPRISDVPGRFSSAQKVVRHLVAHKCKHKPYEYSGNPVSDSVISLERYLHNDGFGDTYTHAGTGDSLRLSLTSCTRGILTVPVGRVSEKVSRDSDSN